MSRIKITDLPKDLKVNKKEMRCITGGSGTFGFLGEESALSLQLLKNRRSKKNATLSNMSKDTFSSEDLIIQNIRS